MLTVLTAAASAAPEHYVVRRDGTKVAIARSQHEFAVTYRKGADIATSLRRLETTGGAEVVDAQGLTAERTKLIRVAEASARSRAQLASDPDVVSVHHVYRFGFDDADAALVSTGTINVKLRAGLSQVAVDELWKDYQVEVVRPIAGLRRVYVVKPVVSGHDEVLRAELLAGDYRTAWAQPNFRSPIRLRQEVPLDEFFSEQWHLNNTGQFGGKVDADIDAPEAWEIAQGEGIIVGMFDDACDVDHEDLADNYIGVGHDPTVLPGEEGADDPRPKDSADAFNRGNRHGTAVMGLAVAAANDKGVRGVAYRSQFTVSRGMVAAGVGMSEADMASVYPFALDQGVDVHNNSWGFFSRFVPAVLEDALETVFQAGRDLDGPHGDGVTNRPPRGMVVVFSAGNETRTLRAGEDLSTLPTVIGVGATTADDRLASYSNVGREIDVVAPGGDSAAFIATTDNDDAAGYLDAGYNTGGIDSESGAPDIDPNGLYTGTFSGTSAAAPIVTGVAALVLSVNPLLTATDVRLILEHTADKVSPDDAEYDGITNRSVRYGYGRVNARSAVEAAQQSLTNGGLTWPERPADVAVTPGRLTWVQNGDPLEFLEDDPTGEIQNDFPTSVSEFLVLESSSPFSFIPVSGECYDVRQSGCGEEGVVLGELPSGVEVKAVGCGLACGTDPGACGPGTQQCVEFDSSDGTRYLAVYARSSIGRYSFGVKADSGGAVVDSGTLPPGVRNELSIPGPSLTISVTPLEGTSPLTVRFKGNASSELEINDDLTEWDFDVDDDDPATKSSGRNATYTYVVPDGESRVFTARLTVYDVGPVEPFREGNPAMAEARIKVSGQASDALGNIETGGDVRITINPTGRLASEPEELELCETIESGGVCGVSPFEVQLKLQGDPPDGTRQTVFWDLGDGSTATSLSVTHTYTNRTGMPEGLVISATVRTETSGGVIVETRASARITVLPGSAEEEIPDVVLPGTTPQGGRPSTSLCGAAGILPLFLTMLLLVCLRRWH